MPKVCNNGGLFGHEGNSGPNIKWNKIVSDKKIKNKKNKKIKKIKYI